MRNRLSCWQKKKKSKNLYQRQGGTNKKGGERRKVVGGERGKLKDGEEEETIWTAACASVLIESVRTEERVQGKNKYGDVKQTHG